MYRYTYMHELTRALYHKFFIFEDELFTFLPAEHITNNASFFDIINIFYDSHDRRIEMRENTIQYNTYKRTTCELYKKFRVKLYHMLLYKYIIFDIRCIIISYLI